MIAIKHQRNSLNEFTFSMFSHLYEGIWQGLKTFGDGKVVKVMPDESRVAVAFAEGEKILSANIAKLVIISD